MHARSFAPKVTDVELREDLLVGVVPPPIEREEAYLEFLQRHQQQLGKQTSRQKRGKGVSVAELKDLAEWLAESADSGAKLLPQLYETGLGRPEKQLPKQVLVDFVTCPQDFESARRFVQTYGLFRPGDEIDGEHPLRSVNAFCKRARKKRQRPFALSLEDLWWEQRRLRTLLKAYTWLSKGNASSRREADRLVRQNLVIPEATMALDIMFTLGLRNAELALDFDGLRAAPSVVTFHVLPGIYAIAWQQMAARSPFGLCMKCEQPFHIDRPRKLYCSLSCQQAAKQARYRERATPALAEKSRTRRTGKARKKTARKSM